MNPSVEVPLADEEPFISAAFKDLITDRELEQIRAKWAERSVEPEVLKNLHVAPDMNPLHCSFNLKQDDCHKCLSPQPIRLECTKCLLPRFFRCFETSCFNRDHWNNFKCRYCKFPRKLERFKTPLMPEQRASNIGWLQQEKVVLFRSKLSNFHFPTTPYPTTEQSLGERIKETRDMNYDSYSQSGKPFFACFHCNKKETKVWTDEKSIDKMDRLIRNVLLIGKMDAGWFCDECKAKKFIVSENVENYCYLCRSPMPIAQNCRSCGDSYKYYCDYPPRCITTEFPQEVGSDRWFYCTRCLKKPKEERMQRKQAPSAKSSKQGRPWWRWIF